MRTLPFAAIALLLARSALAGDGVLEINPSRAVNAGCFAGDTAGYPVTIASSGSYRLTGNPTMSDTLTSGIRIQRTSHVSIARTRRPTSSPAPGSATWAGNSCNGTTTCP